MYRLSPLQSENEIFVEAPGSKSLTNRALILCSLLSTPILLINYSHSSDSEELAECLRELGVTIDPCGEGLICRGPISADTLQKRTLDAGEGGTTYRFLTAILSAIENSDITLTASGTMKTRPIGGLVDSLLELGANIEYGDVSGVPPLKIIGRKLTGGSVKIRNSESSQFASALLLAAPLLGAPLSLDISECINSRTYIDLTIRILRDFGVMADQNGETITVDASNFSNPGRIRIEGDASGATYFWGIGALTGTPVRVNGISPTSFQPDASFPTLLEEMGCSVKVGPTWIEVSRSAPLRGISTDMSRMPDSAVTLAVLAACAEGESEITGLRSLRVKESDRLSSLREGFSALEIECEISDDSIKIYGGKPKPGKIETFSDHRIAMAFSMLGSKVDGITIASPGVVQKSYPEFWEDLKECGVSVEEVH